MQNIALGIMSKKLDTFSTYSYNHLPHIVGVIFIAKTSFAHSWGHLWGFQLTPLHKLALFLYNYAFILIPVFIPLFNKVLGSFSNSLESNVGSLNIFKHISTIIANCLLYLIYILEYFFYIFGLLLRLGLMSIKNIILLLNTFMSFIFNLFSSNVRNLNTRGSNMVSKFIVCINLSNRVYSNSRLYLPMSAFSYIYNNPYFLVQAGFYLFRYIRLNTLYKVLKDIMTLRLKNFFYCII